MILSDESAEALVASLASEGRQKHELLNALKRCVRSWCRGDDIVTSLRRAESLLERLGEDWRIVDDE